MPERLDNLAHGGDLDRRPKDREIEPSIAILGEPLPAMREGSDQANRLEHAIAQRRVSVSLFGLVRLVSKSAGPQQTLKERQGSKETEIGAGRTA